MHAIPSGHAAAPDTRRTAGCRNCGAAAERGQATALHPPTLRELVHEFIARNSALASWNRDRLHGEQLVVVFEARAAAPVLPRLSAILLGEGVGAAVFVVFAIQGALALRRVYGGRVVPTVAREALVVAVGILASLSLFLS